MRVVQHELGHGLMEETEDVEHNVGYWENRNGDSFETPMGVNDGASENHCTQSVTVEGDRGHKLQYSDCCEGHFADPK